MNDYFKTFQNITQFALGNSDLEPSSMELKQSATRLKESAQLCFEELRQSATRLKGLVQVCFDDLRHAEDVWNSKSRVAEAPTHEIWEQLGELSGHDIRILQLENQCSAQAVEKAKKSWSNRIERLTNKWFIDERKQHKKGIGWGEKEGFIKNIRSQIYSQFQEIILIVRHELSLVCQEVNAINLESIQQYVQLLDQQAKADLSTQIDLILSEIETKLGNPTDHITDKLKGFKNTVNPALEALVKQGWGDIYWEQVIKFKDEVSAKIEEMIISIFDDIVKVVTKAIAQVFEFYNDFLERQERYQQEIPEQREADNAWLNGQRQELVQVQKGIEAILNQRAG